MICEQAMNEKTAEHHSSFRVEDVLLLAIERLETDISCTKAKIYSGFYSGIGVSVLAEDIPDDTINPKLWKKLTTIDAKLNLILEKLIQQSEGFSHAQNRKVSLSDEDIQILTSDTFAPEDYVEIKMLLPVHTPVWIVLYGRVILVRAVAADQNEVEIQFTEMDDDVRQVMGYYLLNRHREIVRKIRSSNEDTIQKTVNH